MPDVPAYLLVAIVAILVGMIWRFVAVIERREGQFSDKNLRKQ
jgi:hypothetical protein